VFYILSEAFLSIKHDTLAQLLLNLQHSKPAKLIITSGTNLPFFFREIRVEHPQFLHATLMSTLNNILSLIHKKLHKKLAY